jgi:hypothetical protein
MKTNINFDCLLFYFISFFLIFIILSQPCMGQGIVNESAKNIKIKDSLSDFSDCNFEKLDSLFLLSDFESVSMILKEMTKNNDACAKDYLDNLGSFTNDLISLTYQEIQSSSYDISIENIKLLDDYNFYLSNQDLNWISKKKEISDLKCKFNNQLQKSFNTNIKKAYDFYKSSAKIGSAGELIAIAQFYRLKFFRDTCFNRIEYDNNIKKIVEVSNWIEKSSLDAKYKKIGDSQPEWIKKGMSFEEYQESMAQKLTKGSDYMGGGCNSCGKNLYKGKRGGIYYINKNGNKQYVPRK